MLRILRISEINIIINVSLTISRYSRNSVAYASEFLEYLDEILLRYYMHSDVGSMIEFRC